MSSDMLMRISDYCGVEHDKMVELGILDSLVHYDVPLFINPKLISNCSVEELNGADEKIVSLYRRIISLLKVTNCEDVYWKALKKEFDFPEPSGIGLGTCMASTDGRGLTGKIAENSLRVLKSIVDMGIEDPQMYKLLFLVQENIGVDRVSDMIGRILYSDLLQYTSNMIDRLDISGYQIDDNGLKRLYRPNGRDLVFVPSNILSEIPDVINCEDIQLLVDKNEEVKDTMSVFFDKALNSLSDFRGIKKEKMRQWFFENKEFVVDVLNSYRDKDAEVYDYTNDPLAVCDKFDYIKSFVYEQDGLFVNKLAGVNSLSDLVNMLLNIYKECIENLGLNEELYYKDSKSGRMKVRREVTTHHLFIIVLEVAKLFSKYIYSFEAKVGNGQIEFVITDLNETILAEFKLSTNNLIHGYDVQLPIYIDRFHATYSFYVIIKVTKTNTSIDNFYKDRTRILDNCDVIVVDGTLKPSPSNA